MPTPIRRSGGRIVGPDDPIQKIAVLLNVGQGKLSQPLLKTELGSASGQLAAGDLDGDGVLDLLVGTRFGAVLLRGRQDGSFKWESSGIGGGVVWSLGIQPGTVQDLLRDYKGSGKDRPLAEERDATQKPQAE